MAVRISNSAGKSLEDLEQEITCSICHEHYREPKVLPCCHYYCKQCIRRLSLMSIGDEPFSCPHCRKATTLPVAGVDGLPTAFFVNRLQEIYSSMERVCGRVEAKCEMCPSNRAEAFCRQCALFICAQCVESHQRMKVFSGHETVSLEKLKEGGTIVQEPVVQTCSLHKELMKIYCFDCECCICRDCIIIDHQGHKFQFVSVAAPEVKQEILQELIPLKEVELRLSNAVSEIKNTKSELEAQRQSLANHIERSFDELYKVMENRRSELLKETELLALRKSENLEENLSISRAVTQSVIDYTQQCVDHLSDNDIMVKHAEIQARINKELEDQKDLHLHPIEEPVIGVLVDCAENLKQFCQTEAKISEFVKEYTVTGLETAEVNQQSEILLKSNNSVKHTELLKCSLKSLVSGTITDCEVNHIGSNQFRIQYTPVVRGRHQLILTSNGQKIACSPIPLFACIHPTELGKPIRILSGLVDCHDVAVSPAGIVMVATSSGLLLLDKEGKGLMSSGGLGLDARFYNVAMDNNTDSVYAIIATNASTDVVKLSSDLRLTKRCEIHKTVKRYLSGLTVVGDEVIVSDYSRDWIKVYTKDLCFKRQIGSQGDAMEQFRFIRGVSFDEHDNLYVSEEGRCCIKVFNNEGKFLRSFGCDKDGVDKLRSPVGVCVAGRFVYISDHYVNDCISIFTTGGEYVTSFGQRGNREGDFFCVWGLCVDQDGFVYVCDCGNGRVQVF